MRPGCGGAAGRHAPGSVAAFFSQLSAPPFRAGVPAPPAATASGAPGTLSSGAPSPAVFLLSRACDAELGAVCNLLRQAGVTAIRLNADELAGARLLADPARRAVWLQGRWLTPTAVWLRHFSAQAIGGEGSPAHELFHRESWTSAAGHLASMATASIGTSRPGILSQLQAAGRNGIAVPRTVVTTDPHQAASLLPGRRLVIKAAHQHFVEPAPGALTGVFPAVVTRDRLALPSPPGIPVVLQEYVEHEAELRVYYVAGEVHGFRVGKQEPADPWLDSGRVTVRAVPLEAAVTHAARQLARAFSLHYGAFDFLIRAGAPVFLEVNPDGDWRWAESRAGVTTVTTAAARMLLGLHRDGLPPAAAGDRRRPGHVDLLAFLAGVPGPGLC